MEYQFSKGMNQVFNNSRNEAKRLQSEFLNTEHLLLGIIKSENSSAYAILEDFNADNQNNCGNEKPREILDAPMTKGMLRVGRLCCQTKAQQRHHRRCRIR